MAAPTSAELCRLKRIRSSAICNVQKLLLTTSGQASASNSRIPPAPCQRSRKDRGSMTFLGACVHPGRAREHEGSVVLANHRGWPVTFSMSSTDHKCQQARRRRPGRQGADHLDSEPGMLWVRIPRSEEHTSELQSRVDLVCRL